uniref:Uncharacterized protein n=1 Tax=viral metagenome TaxID=1070528 RepID=A0A6C0IHE4_9ZZZZ
MTTPAKKYQNVSYHELQAYSQHNPNRSSVLPSIDGVNVPLKEEHGVSSDFMGLIGYAATNLTPASILSVMACIADPGYYSLLPQNIRTQHIIDLSTKLQEQTDNLKNTSLSRKRKKIYDLIGAAYNGSAFQDKDYLDLYHGLAHMNQLQFILVKETVQDAIEEGKTGTDEKSTEVKGEIIFSSDPSNWTRDYPVWVADYRGRWVAISEENTLLHPLVGEWLASMEQKAWIIQWHEVDGTKTELVEKLSAMPGWQETDKKHLKEVLALRLGRANAMKLFTSWA